MDGTTTIHELKKAVADFRDAREWTKYDTPRNLAVAISIEAAELLEHFQWKTDMEVEDMLGREEGLESVSDELADVLIYSWASQTILELTFLRWSGRSWKRTQ